MCLMTSLGYWSEGKIQGVLICFMLVAARLITVVFKGSRKEIDLS